MRCEGAFIILLCGLSVFLVTGQERLEQSRSPVRETTFSVGTFANLSVEGDVTDGCKFLFFLDGEACCYSAKKTADILCDPFKQPDICRDKDSFNVVEELGRCELHLPDFQFTDVGKYRTVFPGNLANNQDHIVSTNSLSSGVTFLIFLTVLLVTLLVLIGLIFLFKTLWKMRHGGYENRRERDTEIIEGLLDGNSETVDKCVGNRNILRVRDNNGNTIFHHAAGVDKDKWTERSTEIVNNMSKGKGIPLQQLDSSIVTRTDIFRAKPKNLLDEIYARIPDHTIFDKLKKRTSSTIDVNTVNNKGETPLHVACSKENIVNVKALLDNGAKTDILDKYNTSPVHITVSKNKDDILKLLLPVGGSQEERQKLLKHKTVKDLTPIGLAVTMGFDKIVKYIIEDLKDETWKDEQVNLVYWACMSHEKKTLAVLVDNGAKWTKDWKIKGTSFLQKAAMNGHLEGVKTIMVKEYFEEAERMNVINLVEAYMEKTTEKDKWEPILKIIKDKAPSYWKKAIQEKYNLSY